VASAGGKEIPSFETFFAPLCVRIRALVHWYRSPPDLFPRTSKQTPPSTCRRQVVLLRWRERQISLVLPPGSYFFRNSTAPVRKGTRSFFRQPGQFLLSGATGHFFSTEKTFSGHPTRAFFWSQPPGSRTFAGFRALSRLSQRPFQEDGVRPPPAQRALLLLTSGFPLSLRVEEKPWPVAVFFFFPKYNGTFVLPSPVRPRQFFSPEKMGPSFSLLFFW